MDIVLYNTLPDQAADIRQTVFVCEQGFQEEFDGIDCTASHLLLFLDGQAVATCRFFPNGADRYLVGRIAVLAPYRGRGLGAQLLARAEQEIARQGGQTVCLHAQQDKAPFYEKQGYAAYGPVEYEENYPHIWMMKTLHKTA